MSVTISQQTAGSSRLPVTNVSKTALRAGSGAAGTPSGIPISTSRIFSKSPRSPSSSSFSVGSPTSGQRESIEAATASPTNRQPSTPVSQTTARQRPAYDGRDQHLAVSGLRNVTRSVSERSIDRQSVDSVQLAIKLGSSGDDVGDLDSDRQDLGGLRLIQDELPPFVTEVSGGSAMPYGYPYMTSSKSAPVLSTGMTSDAAILDLTDNPQDSLPELKPSDDVLFQTAPANPSNAAPSPIHTPIRQLSSNHNSGPVPPRSDPTTSKSTSMLIGARHKPVGTSSARQRTVSAVKSNHASTPRSASAHELGQMGTPGKPSPSTSSPASITRSPATNGGLAGSTSSRDHYPAEAYMVPRIAEYKPANGDWENTVIPTIAKQLKRQQEDVGLGIYPNGDAMDARGGEDELVTEWTPDGRPVRVVKVGERSPKMDAGREDSSRAGIVEKREPLGDTERQPLDITSSSQPSSSHLETDDGNPVLADILQDYEDEETYSVPQSNRRSPDASAFPELNGPPHAPSSPPHHDETRYPISTETTDNGQNGTEPKSSARLMMLTNASLGADEGVPASTSSRAPPSPTLPHDLPSHTHSERSYPGTQPSQQPIRTEHHSLSGSRTHHSPTLPPGQSSAPPSQGMEMQIMAGKAGAEKPLPPLQPRPRQTGKEEHGGGCRCIIM